MRKYLFYIFFIIVLCSCRINYNFIGDYWGGSIGLLSIKTDSTFYCKQWELDLGGGKLHCFDGKWEKKGKYIILNSYRQPEQANIFEVVELINDTNKNVIIKVEDYSFFF